MVSYNLIKDFQITADLVAEPVDLITAKKWLRIDFTTDDTLIQSIISSVRRRLERITGLSLGYKTMTCLIEVNDCREFIDLPYGPVDIIDSIEERTSSSTWETKTETTASVDGDYELFGSANSLIKLNNNGYFRFTYKGGFSELPEDLVHDIKVLVAWYYENRGLVMKGEQLNSDIFPAELTLNAYKWKKNVI